MGGSFPGNLCNWREIWVLEGNLHYSYKQVENVDTLPFFPPVCVNIVIAHYCGLWYDVFLFAGKNSVIVFIEVRSLEVEVMKLLYLSTIRCLEKLSLDKAPIQVDTLCK